MSEILLPCPFCGAIAPTVHLSREKNERDTEWQYQLVCDYNLGGCGGSGCFNEDPHKAIEAWNHRVPVMDEYEVYG